MRTVRPGRAATARLGCRRHSGAATSHREYARAEPRRKGRAASLEAQTYGGTDMRQTYPLGPKRMILGLFNVPEYRDRPQPLDQIWRLRNGRRTAECRFWTHPLGAEIRLQVGATLLRSKAATHPSALFDLAMEWKAQFERSGWKAEA